MHQPLQLYLRSLILDMPSDLDLYLPPNEIQYIFEHSIAPSVDALEYELLRFLRSSDHYMQQNVQEFRDELSIWLVLTVSDTQRTCSPSDNNMPTVLRMARAL